MNEITQLFQASPQAALVGATVYLILALRRTDARVEEIATHIGLAPRKKTRGAKFGILVAIGLALTFTLTGCVVSRKCTKAGVCTTHVGTSTNAVPMLREFGKWLRIIP